jgi:hypothetical protein
MRIKRNYVPPLFLAAAGAAAMYTAPMADPSDLVRVSSADPTPENDGCSTDSDEAAPLTGPPADSDIIQGTDPGTTPG